MPTVNLPPVLRQIYNDSNGKPLAGGLLYSYQAGTTTLQNTYTDSTGLTANANPIVLDANGGASMWLDPSLSYKFILKDSLGTLQWTQDGVVGLLTVDAVNTASIQDGAVTTIKIADASITGPKLASDASVDANRPVDTNNIKNGAVTHAKINSTSGFLAPTVQKFISGSGTYNKSYYFFVSGANATVGATYTHNGVTYTVSSTISSGALLVATGSADPLSSGTLTKATGTGDATIAFTAFSAPLYINVEMVGGGAGGTGGGGGMTAGGNTTFGTSLLTANGGAVGATNAPGGAGGTATIASPAVGIAVSGSYGGSASNNGDASILCPGGTGGASPFGGAGSGGSNSSGQAGISAATNSGSGGGGFCAGFGGSTGAGGGAGGYVNAVITSPSATYAYAVGAAGSGGAATAGGNGGAGLIIVKEFYQ